MVGQKLITICNQKQKVTNIIWLKMENHKKNTQKYNLEMVLSLEMDH